MGVERALGDGTRNGVCLEGGYFADVLAHWLVQMLGEGQPLTTLSPSVGKRNKGRQRGKKEGADMCFNVDIRIKLDYA